MTETFTITELAREFEVTSRTIRFYEDKGLIAPERRGTARLFNPRDRTRLRLILRGKRLGLTLAEIAEIVDMYDAEPGEKGQLELLIARIGERRARLEQQKRDIDATLADLDGVKARCVKRLQALAGAKRRRA